MRVPFCTQLVIISLNLFLSSAGWTMVLCLRYCWCIDVMLAMVLSYQDQQQIRVWVPSCLLPSPPHSLPASTSPGPLSPHIWPPSKCLLDLPLFLLPWVYGSLLVFWKKEVMCGWREDRRELEVVPLWASWRRIQSTKGTRRQWVMELPILEKRSDTASIPLLPSTWTSKAGIYPSENVLNPWLTKS